MLVGAQLYLVDSTVEKGPGEVESLLGADRPVASQIQPVDKHDTFLPALHTQRKLSEYTHVQKCKKKNNN